MNRYVITIDTGTTNTRTILWNKDKTQIAKENRKVGVRDTAIDGNNHRLKAAVKECLECLLSQADICYKDIDRVIASGMITSNVGLVEIPHLVVPVGVNDLAIGATSVLLEDICPIPIWFIPGVKNSSAPIDMGSLEQMDIMRGEEVESVYIIEQFKGRELLLVLPGSHTKFVSVNSSGEITGCLTTITGELHDSIINHTILADAVGRRYIEESTYDSEMLLKGYDSSKRVGLGRTCFSGRILNQFVTKDVDKVGNFLMGAVLQSDVAAILNSTALEINPDTMVIVAGKNPLRQAISDILAYEGFFAHVEQFVAEADAPLSALGTYIVAEKSMLL